MEYTFEKYLILVGIRSKTDYNYNDEDLLNNIEYFRNCYENEMSAYRALLYFRDYVNDDFKMEKQQKLHDVLSQSQIASAINFYKNHQMHIDNIVAYAEKAYPPTLAEDKSYCMIWKAEHWKWFLNAE